MYDVYIACVRPAAFDNNNNNIEILHRPSEKDACEVCTHYVYRLWPSDEEHVLFLIFFYIHRDPDQFVYFMHL